MSPLLARTGPGTAAAATTMPWANASRAEDASDWLSLCLATEPAVTPAGIWSAWSFAPEVALPLAGLGVLVLWAALRPPPQDTAGRARRLSFAVAGLLLLAAALVSPLCRLAATLVSAHMAQHIVLVALAPPLLALALPVRRRGLAAPVRLGLWTALYGGAIWLWHLPPVYEAALQGRAAHLLMYGSLLVAAGGFWLSILAAARSGDSQPGLALLALLVTFVHTGLLGALLVFARGLWYPLLAPGARAWGLTPLEDQQLAGLIMWIPMGTAYLVAALTVAASRLAQLEDRTASDRLGAGARSLPPKAIRRPGRSAAA